MKENSLGELMLPHYVVGVLMFVHKVITKKKLSLTKSKTFPI